MGEQLVNCPTCGGSGQKATQQQIVVTDDDGIKHSETVVVYKDCTVCNGMGVIPGGPPV